MQFSLFTALPVPALPGFPRLCSSPLGPPVKEFPCARELLLFQGSLSPLGLLPRTLSFLSNFFFSLTWLQITNILQHALATCAINLTPQKVLPKTFLSNAYSGGLINSGTYILTYEQNAERKSIYPSNIHKPIS